MLSAARNVGRITGYRWGARVFDVSKLGSVCSQTPSSSHGLGPSSGCASVAATIEESGKPAYDERGDRDRMSRFDNRRGGQRQGGGRFDNWNRGGPRRWEEAGTAFADAGSSSPMAQIVQGLYAEQQRSGRTFRHAFESVMATITPSGEKVTPRQALLLIRSCGQSMAEELPSERTKLVHMLWRLLEKQELQLDIGHYNTLLSVYLENDHPFDPMDFLARLKQNEIPPTRFTYLHLIRRCCNEKAMNQAGTLLEEMKEKGMAANERILNALVLGYMRSGDESGFNGVMGMLAENGLDAEPELYRTLLQCHAEKGDIEAIQNQISEASQKDVLLTDEMYLNTIYHLAVNGHNQHVDEILMLMPKRQGYGWLVYGVIVRLTTAGQLDTALALLKTMNAPITREGESTDQRGNFFLRQMVRVDTPVEKLLEICEKMKADDLHESSFETALHYALRFQKLGQAKALLQAIENKGLPLQELYYYPIIAMQTRMGDLKELMSVLSDMHKHGFPVLKRHFVDFVLPNTNLSLDQILPAAKAWLPPTTEDGAQINWAEEILNAGVVHGFQSGNYAAVESILDRYKFFFLHPTAVAEWLGPVFICTGNSQMVTKTLLRIQHPQRQRIRGAALEQTGDYAGMVVRDILNELTPEQCLPLLEDMRDSGLVISNDRVKFLRSVFQFSDSFNQVLDELTVPRDVVKEVDLTSKRIISIEDTESLVEHNRSQGRMNSFHEKYLLQSLCRSGQKERVEAMLPTLSPELLQLPTTAAMLCDMYIVAGDLDKALEYKEKLRELRGYNLDGRKLLRLAELLVKNDKIEDALQLLSENPQELSATSRERTDARSLMNPLARQVSMLLDTVSVKGQPELVRHFVDTLTAQGFVDPHRSASHLRFIIKAHLSTSDKEGALKAYDEIAEQYKFAANRLELFAALADDTAALEKAFDTAKTHNGQLMSQRDLAFAMILAGKLDVARKAIRDLNGPLTHNQMMNFANYLINRNLTAEYMFLLDATKGFRNQNRDVLYRRLIGIHRRSKDWRGALETWHAMQEEDLLPSVATMQFLAETLRECGQDVPFQLPKQPTQVPLPSSDVASGKKSTPSGAMGEPIQSEVSEEVRVRVGELFSMVQNKDLDTAYEHLQDVTAGYPLRLYATFIRQLLLQDRVKDAANLTESLSMKNRFLDKNVIIAMARKLADSGDVSAIKRLQDLLPAEKAQLIDIMRQRARIINGESEAVFDDLVKQGQSPYHLYAAILDARPDLFGKLKETLSDAELSSQPGLARAVAIRSMANGNVDEGIQIFKDHNIDITTSITPIAQSAKDADNETMLRELMAKITLTDGQKGILYSYILGMRLAKTDVGGGVKVVEEALGSGGLTLDHIRHPILLRLKVDAERTGVPFPFTMPPAIRNRVVGSGFRRRGGRLAGGRDAELHSDSDGSSSSSGEETKAPRGGRVRKEQL